MFKSMIAPGHELQPVSSTDSPAATPGIPGHRPKSRILEIDALRGLAAIAVVIYHFTSSLVIQHRSPLIVEFHYGTEFVFLFFAISGYVIMLSAERSKSIADFAVARFARLYPAYWVAVIASFLLVHYSGGLIADRTTSRLHALVNLSMFQRAFGMPDLDGPFWSLYVELSFYVIVALLMKIQRLSWLAWGLAGAALILAVARWTGVAGRLPVVGQVLRLLPVLHFAEYFGLGVWCFRLSRSWDWRFVPVFLVLLGYAASKREVVDFVIISAVFLAATYGKLPFLTNRALLFLGTISYSLYLLHRNLGRVVMGWLELRGVDSNVAVVIAIAASLAAAALACFAVEQPANQAIRSWWRNRRHSEERLAVESAAG